ncbi:MAG: DNA gyrase subunit A, partial [Rikenellaceae bacterium]
IPYGKNTSLIIESIIRANDKGKIKIKKVDDNTSHSVEIVISLGNEVSSDMTIDALYAFTKCEVSISPNSCIIIEDKPNFMGVTNILKLSAENTKRLLNLELEIRLKELYDSWHKASLEKIFIENRIYKLIENAKSNDEMLAIIDKGLDPYKHLLWLPVTQEDLIRLGEIPIRRTAQFDLFKNQELISGIEEEIKEVKANIANIVNYTIDFYQEIMRKYSKGKERRTEIRNFDNIVATNVVINNTKLYGNKKEGFFGTGASMRKEEFICECSDIDDIIIFTKSGKYIITKVSDKAFFEKDIYYIGVFRRNDSRTVYNVLYVDGATGASLVKRCQIQGVTRDKEYDITKGSPKSQILYMSVNGNGEAEVLKVYFRPRPRLKKLIADLDFADILIKGRQSQGNIFSRFPIHKIVMKEVGVSTLGGQRVWLDTDINKLNTEGRGELLGDFFANDKLIIFTASGNYYTASYNPSLYFPEDLTRIEKYDSERVYSAVLYDSSQAFFYIKRFKAEDIDKLQLFIEEESGSYLVEINSDD